MSTSSSSSTSSITTNTFTNPANSTLVARQIGARAAGKTPSFVQNASSITLTLLEREIKPLEKTAVIYHEYILLDRITDIFIKTLQDEKGSSLSDELLAKASAIKNQLLVLFERFCNIDPQLNCLKIITFRLCANIGKLCRDKNVCSRQISQSVKRGHSNVKIQNNSVLLTNLLKIELGIFLNAISDIEHDSTSDETNFFSTFQNLDASKRRLEVLLQSVSDLSTQNSKLKDTLQQIQNDLDLVSSLQLAPRTLIPLAIAALGNTPLQELSPGSHELEELFQAQFYFVYDMLEMQDEMGPKTIKQKGTPAKKCKEAIHKFFQTFKEKYKPLQADITQSYQSICKQIYTKDSTNPTEHFHKCQKLLKELNLSSKIDAWNKAYNELFKILAEAPSIPDFEGLKINLINRCLLPFHAACQRFYSNSTKCLETDLKIFFQAHEQYTQSIPKEQREMVSGLYTPIDLIYFNFLTSIDAIISQVEPSSFSHLNIVLGKTYQIVVQAKECYQLCFPYFEDKKLSILQCVQKIAESLDQVKQSNQTTTSLMGRSKSILNCLMAFITSSPSYPFLFNCLGSQPLQPSSYELHFSALLLNFIYQKLQEWSDQKLTTEQMPITITEKEPGVLTLGVEELPSIAVENGFSVEDIGLSFSQPVTKGEYTLFNSDFISEEYLQKDTSLGWELKFFLPIFTIWWEDIPKATPTNLQEISPKFFRLMNRIKAKFNALSMIKFTEDAHTASMDHIFKFLEPLVLLPYQNLSRHIAGLSIESTASNLKLQTSSTSPQRYLVQSASSMQEVSLVEPLVQPLIDLHSCAEQIGYALALLPSSFDANSLLDMRDFHSQIVYHLRSIEDLLTGDIRALSIVQLQTLLTHQAYALEQSIKLAATARLPLGKQSELLTKLLRSSHRPSDFLSSLSMHPHADPAEWEKALKTASAVDGFLTAPARYALITHPWMGLLTNLSEQDEVDSEQATNIELVIQLSHDNLSALKVLLADTYRSLPAPNQPFTSSSPLGSLDGLKDKKLLQLPAKPVYTPYSPSSLSTSLNTLAKVNNVSRLSQDEKIAHLIQRREEFHSNLYIIQTNLEQVEMLLQEITPCSWCSSYSSTLLLRAAAVLEKSVQTLLFWLPIPSSSDPGLHYLLSTRSGPGGNTVPLKHTHSIKDNALLCANHLAGSEGKTLAQSLSNLGEQFSWLDPFIQQLYRYPFSPLDNQSANILRLFNALAYVRHTLHQGDSSTETMLQKELGATPENVNLLYDQLIQAHLNATVIAPVHEILQASQTILAILLKLVSPPVTT